MFHQPIVHATPSRSNDLTSPKVAPWRSRRGRTNHFSGIAAEHSVCQRYQRNGASVLGQRIRTPEGELDLILQQDDVLVFVEVKKRRRIHGCDSPVTPKQWHRLEKAALHYMMDIVNDTGVQPVCRFDVALVAADGSADIIENAWSFDVQ